MFDTTHVVCKPQTTVVLPTTKPDPTKVEINKKSEGGVFVRCRKGDDVWNGLFYATPFLNREDSSRGSFYALRFDRGDPTRIERHEDYHWRSYEENRRDYERYKENIKKILRIQAVDVVQIRFISATEVIAEVKYLNPKEV